MKICETTNRRWRAALFPAIAISLAVSSATAAQPGNIRQLQLGIAVEKGADCPRADLEATCGRQVRTSTTTVGSYEAPRIIKVASPATKPANGKPTTKPVNGQSTTKPVNGQSTTKPTKLCKNQKIVATRHGALTRPGGIKTARISWMAGVKKKYGTGWMNPNHAKNWKQECKLSGTFTCTVSGYPCAD